MKKSVSLLLLLLAARTAMAESGQQLIQGFKFQTCQADRCLEISADKAWMSQLGFSFTTEGTTSVTIRAGGQSKTYSGISAVLHDRLKMVVLDQADGSAKFFSLDDLKEAEMHQ